MVRPISKFVHKPHHYRRRWGTYVSGLARNFGDDYEYVRSNQEDRMSLDDYNMNNEWEHGWSRNQGQDYDPYNPPAYSRPLPCSHQRSYRHDRQIPPLHSDSETSSSEDPQKQPETLPASTDIVTSPEPAQQHDRLESSNSNTNYGTVVLYAILIIIVLQLILGLVWCLLKRGKNKPKPNASSVQIDKRRMDFPQQTIGMPTPAFVPVDITEKSLYPTAPFVYRTSNEGLEEPPSYNSVLHQSTQFLGQTKSFDSI